MLLYRIGDHVICRAKPDGTGSDAIHFASDVDPEYEFIIIGIVKDKIVAHCPYVCLVPDKAPANIGWIYTSDKFIDSAPSVVNYNGIDTRYVGVRAIACMEKNILRLVKKQRCGLCLNIS